MNSFLTKNEAAKTWQVFKFFAAQIVAVPWLTVFVCAVIVGAVADLAGLSGAGFALDFVSVVGGPIVLFQTSMLLTVGIIGAWHFITARHRINTYLRHVAGRLNTGALRWARRWARMLRGVCLPFRQPTLPVLRLAWRDRVAIIGSSFVAGESPQLE